MCSLGLILMVAGHCLKFCHCSRLFESKKAARSVYIKIEHPQKIESRHSKVLQEHFYL